MHIFLTGDLQIGKSTLIAKTVTEKNINIAGFCTKFNINRENPNKLLYMQHPLKMDEFNSTNVVVKFLNGKPKIFNERFNEIGCKLLDESVNRSQLIVMDEFGRFEKDALIFKNKVFHILNGNIPVLGVLRQGLPGWTGEIASRNDVGLIMVTKENRDELKVFLSKWLTQIIEKQR